MFHGSSSIDPKTIFSGEYGLDNRFASSGMYGKGSYFANNAMYSHNYAYNPNGAGKKGGLFGPLANQPPVRGLIFGGPAANPPNIFFGAAPSSIGLFGGGASNPSGSLFGGVASNPSGGLFGVGAP